MHKYTASRDPYWDVVKGLLIILVVLGHAAQYAEGGDYGNLPLFKGIYLFHMPLFALVSGYFAHQSFQRHGWRFIVRNARHLLLPSLFPLLIYTACIIVKACLTGVVSRTPQLGIFQLVWFLICMFECSVFAGILFHRKSLCWRTTWIALPMILAVTCCEFPFAGKFTFLYPFFLIGAWVRAYGCKLNLVWAGVVASTVYSSVFCIFRGGWYVYDAPMDYLSISWEVVSIYLIRMVGGIAGCFLFLFVCKRLAWIQRNKALQTLGRNTLPIYILQGYFWLLFLTCSFPKTNIWTCFPLAITVVALCYMAGQLIKRLPLLRLLMFGEL